MPGLGGWGDGSVAAALSSSMVAASSPFLAAALTCSRAAADTGRQERRRRPQKRPLPLPLLDCQFHLARTSPFTSAVTAGSDRAPQRLPMGITLPTTTAYSPCTGVDTPLMARWALASTLPEAEWMHRALLVLRA